MTRLRQLADLLIRLCAVIGSAGILLVTAVILVDVVGRALGSPLVGARDISEMTMVIIVFGGMALCDRKGGHVAVDVLEARYSARFNRAIDVTAALAGAAIFAAIAWTVWDSSRISQMLNLSTNILNLPKAWFQWALCGFAAVTALGMLLRGLELALTGRDVRHQRGEGA